MGDIDGIIAMIHEIGKGTPMGRILGAGTATTARCFGIERAPVVKGQAMPAYDPRAVKGQGVTYATTTMGADHTAGYAVATNILDAAARPILFPQRGRPKYPGTCRSLRPLSMPRAIASLRHLPCSISLKPCRLLSIRSMPCMI